MKKSFSISAVVFALGLLCAPLVAAQEESIELTPTPMASAVPMAQASPAPAPVAIEVAPEAPLAPSERLDSKYVPRFKLEAKYAGTSKVGGGIGIGGSVLAGKGTSEERSGPEGGEKSHRFAGIEAKGELLSTSGGGPTSRYAIGANGVIMTGVEVSSPEGKSGAKIETHAGASVSGDKAMDKPWQVKAEAGVATTLEIDNFTFTWNRTGEAGVAKSGDKILPFVQARTGAEIQQCFGLDSAKKNEICGKLAADVAAGLIQLEVRANAGVVYKRKIASDGTKLVVEGGVGGEASLDLAGTHGYKAGGVSVGIAR